MDLCVTIGAVRWFENGQGENVKMFPELYSHVTVLHRNKFLFNNKPDAVIIQIHSVIKFYMFRASSLPIIRSFLLYIRHW